MTVELPTVTHCCQYYYNQCACKLLRFKSTLSGNYKETRIAMFYNGFIKENNFNTKIICIKNCLLIIALSILTERTSANDLHFVINGISHHTSNEPEYKYNESNIGFGVQYDFNEFDRNLVPFLNVGGFSDSNKNPSYYIGSGLMHRTTMRSYKSDFHIDAGMTMFFMSRDRKTNSEIENSIFPGILPMISIGTDTTSVNITYIPKIDNIDTSVWFIQLKLKLNSF